ncbi:MAG: cupredoxin domain-containing protein [Nitrososphaerales archaeon]
MNKVAILAILVATVILMATYNFSQFAEAQTRERCDADICHVKITKDGFMPKILTVKVGTGIVWTNTDDRRHTVTSGSPGEATAPLKSLLLEKGDTYEFTFSHAGLYQGSYKYFDQVTKTMRGEIIVEEEVKKTEEKLPEVETIEIYFQDPKSGVKKVLFPTGTIKSMYINPESRSLIINLEIVSTGTLEITMDRSLIDAKRNGKDDRFMVLVKKVTSPFENEGNYEEISSTPSERGLRIFVPAKTEQIRIVGTQIIPEFPVAVMAVMGVIVATAIAISRFKNSLSS